MATRYQVSLPLYGRGYNDQVGIICTEVVDRDLVLLWLSVAPNLGQLAN